MKRLFLIALTILMAFSLSACGVSHVDPNEELALVSKLGDGKGSIQVYGTGWQFYNPLKWTGKTFSLARTTIKWVTEDPNTGAFTFNSSKGLKFQVDVGATVQMRKGASAEAYRLYKKDINAVLNSDFGNNLREAFNDAGSQRATEEIYGDKKAFVDAVEEIMQKRFSVLFQDVDIFLLNDMILPPSVKAGIERKEAARQKAEQRENEIAEATADRLKKQQATDAVAYEIERTAQAKAKEITSIAEAEAKAIMLKRAQITPEYVEYVKVNGWDGKLPQVTGGAGTLIDLR